jgi:peroxiredoxin Q/BCP
VFWAALFDVYLGGLVNKQDQMVAVQTKPRVSLRGELSKMPFTDLLRWLQREEATGLLTLKLTGEIQNTRVVLARGRLGGVISPLLPNWSISLLQDGVPPSDLQEARLFADNTPQFFKRLVSRGSISTVRLIELLQERIVAGLLPLVYSSQGHYSFRPKDDVGDSFMSPGIEIGSILKEIRERLSGRHDRKAFAYHPTSVFEVFDQNGDALDVGLRESRVLSVLADGLPLWEVAKNTNLAWDDLTQTVATLEQLDLVGESARIARAEDAARSTRLYEGDVAHPFRLTAVEGDVYSLGRLRGAKLLLVFGASFERPSHKKRYRELVEWWPEFRETGLRVVCVVESSIKVLRKQSSAFGLPFTVLVDPDGLVHRRYGAAQSWGAFGTRSLGTLMSSLFSRGLAPSRLARRPIELLVGEDLRVEKSHYHRHMTDFLPIEEIYAWAESS